MQTHPTYLHPVVRLAGALLTLLLLVLVFMTGSVQATQPDENGEHKVAICHRTHSDTNPYVYIKVDVASVSPGHLGNADPGHKPTFWKTDGVWRGVPHSAGDPKDDYLATSEADCNDTEVQPSQSPSPSATPSASLTPTPTPTSSTPPSATPSQSPSPTVVPPTSPSTTPVPSTDPSPTSTPSPTEDLIQTPVPTLPPTDTSATAHPTSGVELTLLFLGAVIVGATCWFMTTPGRPRYRRDR